MNATNLALLHCLLKLQIPFDLTYKPGTQKDEPSLQLTIYINPKTSINFDLELDKPCSNT